MDEKQCERCGTPASPGAQFCESCGAPFAAAPQATQQGVPPTPRKEITLTISYVPVIQLAKVVGVVSGILFFIIGIFYGVGAGAATASVPGLGISGALLAIVIIIVMPIFGFVSGFIEAAIIAFVYNWIVPRIGGIQVQVR